MVVLSGASLRMYDLINHHIQIILQSIPQNDVADYDWLIQNLQQVSTPDYQAKYRSYWGMNGAGLGPAYRAVYFQELQSALTNPPALGSLAAKLYQTPTSSKGQSLQRVFATKLLHTADRQIPIYDSNVAAFYFFQPLDSG